MQNSTDGSMINVFSGRTNVIKPSKISNPHLLGFQTRVKPSQSSLTTQQQNDSCPKTPAWVYGTDAHRAYMPSYRLHCNRVLCMSPRPSQDPSFASNSCRENYVISPCDVSAYMPSIVKYQVIDRVDPSSLYTCSRCSEGI